MDTQTETAPGRLARRWVRQHYHPAFGYATSVSLHRKRGTENWRGNPLAAFGKVAEVVADKPDAPLVWDAEEAIAMLERSERIGYVYADRNGYLHVGIADKLTPPVEKDWRDRVRNVVRPAAPAIRSKQIREEN
ncbi:hypothetical protein FJY70_00255 [candidate division WOR-3 bacterium]|nr:hypothetical protein [candidate division WOR-3 bacterium]